MRAREFIKTLEAYSTIGSTSNPLPQDGLPQTGNVPNPALQQRQQQQQKQKTELSTDDKQIMALGNQLKLTPQELQTLGNINTTAKSGSSVTDPRSEDLLAKLGKMALNPQTGETMKKIPSLVALIGKQQATKSQATPASPTTSVQPTNPNTYPGIGK